jgi:UDP-N-acetylglucosamine 2-epimerase (non-hydrolysing)
MRILTVFGTRPEAIKLAPVVRLLADRNDVQHATCVTGQHREMLDQVCKIFDLRPDFDLNLMSANQSLHRIASKAVDGVADVIRRFNPDWIIVQGDTTTAFSAALAGFYSKVKVAHVEAGLRTGNIYSPWPEEMNRKLIGSLAAYHFAPTQRARENLEAEGVPASLIEVTGNTVIDALHWVSERLESGLAVDAVIPGLDSRKRVILVTGHRRENFDGGLARVCDALIRIANRGDVHIVYPVHLNPTVQTTVRAILGSHPSISLLEPFDYLPFVALMKRAYLIVTDSGGIQEEAPALGKPVLVTRDTTERPEAIEAGTARLVGTDPEVIVSAVNELLDNQQLYYQMATATNPFGDGLAAQRIVQRLVARESLKQ